jgi:hypothetical protein
LLAGIPPAGGTIIISLLAPVRPGILVFWREVIPVFIPVSGPGAPIPRGGMPVTVAHIILPLFIRGRAVRWPLILIPVIVVRGVIVLLVLVGIVPVLAVGINGRSGSPILASCRGKSIIIGMAGVQVPAPPLLVPAGVAVRKALAVLVLVPEIRTGISAVFAGVPVAAVAGPGIPIFRFTLIFHYYKDYVKQVFRLFLFSDLRPRRPA